MSCWAWTQRHAVWHSGQCRQSKTWGSLASRYRVHSRANTARVVQLCKLDRAGHNETHAPGATATTPADTNIAAAAAAAAPAARQAETLPPTSTALIPRRDETGLESMPATLSRSLAYRRGRPPQDRPAPSAQRPAPSSCIQLPFPGPGPGPDPDPGPKPHRPPFPTPPASPPSLSRSQHAGRPLPCRCQGTTHVHTASCLVESVSAITSANNALCLCLLLFFLLLGFLPCFITHTPPPPPSTPCQPRPGSAPTACRAICAILQGLVRASSIVSCLSSEPPSVRMICPGGVFNVTRGTRSPLQTPGGPGSFTSVSFVARGFVVRAEPSAFPPSQRKGSACEADGSSDRGDSHHPGQGASGRQTSLRQPWSGVSGRELREDCPSRALTA